MKQNQAVSYRAPQEYARQAVLEEVANRLLEAAQRNRPPRAYPYYTERALGRRVLQDVQTPWLELDTLPPTLAPLQAALRQLTRTRLDPRKRLAFRLLARGHAAEEVATLLGINRPQLSRWKAEACAALREALGQARDDLLQRDQQIREAFREDTGRHAEWEERHCDAGHEGCRRSRQCVCRWYLHYSSE